MAWEENGGHSYDIQNCHTSCLPAVRGSCYSYSLLFQERFVCHLVLRLLSRFLA